MNVWRTLNCLIIVQFSKSCLFTFGGDVAIFRVGWGQGEDATLYLTRPDIYLLEILNFKEKQKNLAEIASWC